MNNIINNINNNENVKKLKEIVNFLLNQEQNVTDFVGYDIGIGRDKISYEDETSKYCQNFEIGVLNQGFFQMTTFNEDRWRDMREYLKREREDIKEFHLFFCSTSLVAAASPVLTALPFINVFHTSIGIQIIGNGGLGDKYKAENNGKIKRTMLFQLEFGDIDGIGDAVKRFLTPQFCMTPIFEDSSGGKLKDPLTFTPEEFNKNLFIDYSKTISTIMGNFLESQDYITEKLVKSMATTDAANVHQTAPMPYQDFLRQNMKMGDFFEAYNNYRTDKTQNIGGMANGSIFELCTFGPSPLSQKAGAIVNFASTRSVDDIIKIIDFVFTNYNGCTSGMNNADQHYCLLGVDKITPIESLTNSQIKDMLNTKPNIVTTDNGFIREMRGRTTHCNTVCAVLITLAEEIAKENSSQWTIYTDWTNIDVQENNFYMLNPAIPNIPVAEFSPGYEYGVSIKEFNTNPIYAEDKKKFYKYMFFIKMVTNGMPGVGESQVLNTANTNKNDNALATKIFSYLLVIFQNSFANEIIKHLFSSSFFSKYQYTYIFLIMLLILYVVISYELFEDFFWVTGQPTVDSNGNPAINVTDPYPYVWKINIKKNRCRWSYFGYIWLINKGHSWALIRYS